MADVLILLHKLDHKDEPFFCDCLKVIMEGGSYPDELTPINPQLNEENQS